MAKKTPLNSVKYERRELIQKKPQYWKIRDAIQGEDAIKGLTSPFGAVPVFNPDQPVFINNSVLSRAKRYLPQPNAEDESEANMERYRAYVTRAVYYNVTGKTLEGMIGQIFLRDPVATLTPNLEILLQDADGAGLGLDQVAAKTCSHVIAYGRAGIFVDYPIVTTPVTKKQVADGDIHPTFRVYEALDIINWRTVMVGAKAILVLVVLRELVDQEVYEGFEPQSFEQYRVLRLTPSADGSFTYSVEIWKPEDVGKNTPTATYTPQDSTGAPLTQIPFYFVGAEDNDVKPGEAPMYDMATVNIAHYRNSADYEESCFIAGQPTTVLTGLTADWVANVLKGALTIGSRANIPLPVGGDAKIIQAQPNSMPFEAMIQKEAQMVALGARLVKAQPKKSATAKIIDESSENSMLSMISRNVSAAITLGLVVAAKFVGDDPTKAATTTDGQAIKVGYLLNDDFDLTTMTADEQNAVILQWQSAAISFGEMRAALRKGGIATMKDADARVAIQKDITDGMIPDPRLENVPPVNIAPKAASDAGGPQPTPVRTPPTP